MLITSLSATVVQYYFVTPNCKCYTKVTSHLLLLGLPGLQSVQYSPENAIFRKLKF